VEEVKIGGNSISTHNSCNVNVNYLSNNKSLNSDLSKADSSINDNVNNLICILNIFYQNVWGLRFKLNLVGFTFPVFYSYDVLLFFRNLSYSWYSEFGIGFNFLVFRFDRNSATSNFSQGDGVLIAIKSNLNPSPITLTASNVEQIFVKQLSYLGSLFLAQCTYLQQSFSIL